MGLLLDADEGGDGHQMKLIVCSNTERNYLYRNDGETDEIFSAMVNMTVTS